MLSHSELTLRHARKRSWCKAPMEGIGTASAGDEQKLCMSDIDDDQESEAEHSEDPRDSDNRDWQKRAQCSRLLLL